MSLRESGALAGLLATGVGLGLGHGVAGFSGRASSPIVAVGDRVIELSPPAMKEWAVATLGTANKPVLIGAVLLVTLALGALVGVLARRSLLIGLMAGSALIVVALGAAFDARRPATWWLPGSVALLSAAATLVLLLRPEGEAVGDSAAVGGAAGNHSRRGLLRLVAAAGVGLLGWLVGEGIGVAGSRKPGATGPVSLPSFDTTPLPPGLEVEVPGVSPFVTPTPDFFRIDTVLFPPVLDAATWRLTIDGMVDHPYSISFDELLAMDVIERPVTLACVSNPVGGSYIGSTRWLGVRTSELLARAGVQAGADQVLSWSSDGFTVSTPLPALLDDRDALVAFGMDGVALPVEHGYPARLMTPGLYGFVGATKWLVRMQVTTYASAEAFWTKQGWSATGPVKPSSRIEVPSYAQQLDSGPVKVGGTAWAPEVGVGGVQVRVDGGPWQDVTLGPDGGVPYWRQWVWSWDAPPGDHVLQARVVDARGTPQSEQLVDSFPDGASGLHSVRVTVS